MISSSCSSSNSASVLEDGAAQPVTIAGPGQQPMARRPEMSHWTSDTDSDSEDELFTLDDLASSTPSPGSPSHQQAPTRAYTRAVCVSFVAPPLKAAPRNGLEGKVKFLVADFFTSPAAATAAVSAAAAGNDADAPLLESLAAHLRIHGLRVEVLAPPRPNARTPLTTRSIRDPFLTVSASDVDMNVDGCEGGLKGANTIIVDRSLYAHLSLAPATPSYLSALATVLPPSAQRVFVGSRTRLAQLVHSLAPSIALNFSSQGMELPPWRRTSALLHRWAAVEEAEREREQQQQQRDRGDGAGQSQAQPLALAQEQQQVIPRPFRVVAGAKQQQASTPLLIMSGFEVGSTAVGVEPWRDSAPGSFAFSFGAAAALRGSGLALRTVGQRRREQEEEVAPLRPRSEDSDDSNADIIAGVFPVDVFGERRGAPPPAFGSCTKAW